MTAVARWVCAAAAVAILSACTTTTPPGDVVTRLPTSPTPVMTPVDGMTAVPELAQCVEERPDGGRSTLPGQELLPAAFPGVVSARVLVPGRDAPDASRCPATLTETFSCRDTTTWAVPDAAEFLVTFAAREARVVEGTSAARTQSTGDGRSPGAPKRSFTYAEYALAAGDPRHAVAFEQHAFGTCAPSTARLLDGVAVHTATLGTQTGLVDVAFLVAGDRLAQVALSGSRWEPAERDHVWRVVAQRLRQQG